ncbi:ATP-binding protein [Plantactinospora sp. GCM10030261]|uniref:sensor histidine kinase n=1 Tax=Plantactinospora sp. GCM10030261 TaxID=3273420 RepID=UPI0036206F6A
MPDPPDYRSLIAGHTAVIDMINTGDAGLPMLGRMLRTVQRSLRADGMVFVEYAPAEGRIVAATGAAEWTVGRPVPVGEPPTAPLTNGPRCQELRVEALAEELAAQLDGHGLARMLVARAEIGGVTVGGLHALYAEQAPPPGEEDRSVLTYVASCIAHLYGDQAGLPVHGDGPVVAALADGLAIVDRDGGVRLWNPAAERVTGLAAAHIVNRPIPFPVPPPGQVVDHRLPDGRWLKITSGELPGSVASRVVTFSDVTDQHQRDLDRDLFVAVTSHELRTPITVIKGFADTLNNHWDSVPEPDRQEAARVIGQRADELARLVDRLLSAATGAGSMGGARPVPFDLPAALREAVVDLPADLRRRLVLALPTGLPTAAGDPTSVPTVLTELVTNAGKYAPAGSSIEVSAEADERSVVFRVSDRGIGVRPEHVERAFDRFWQGESGDRRRYPGAGLGLYLVRRIVERQKGWVSLRPRAGGGTVAEVRLPRGSATVDGRPSGEEAAR